MRPIRINIDLDTVDVNNVFEDQQVVGAGDFTLNGTAVIGGEWITADGFAKQLSFESTGNFAARTLTVTGFEDLARHKAITETLSGPNNETVETSNYFYVVTSIATDGNIDTNMESGFVDEAVSQTLPLSWRNGNCGIFFDVTGTINYTLEVTADDVYDLSAYPYTWTDADDSDVVASTTSQHSNFIATPVATRYKINSYSAGAALKATIYQRDV